MTNYFNPNGTLDLLADPEAWGDLVPPGQSPPSTTFRYLDGTTRPSYLFTDQDPSSERQAQMRFGLRLISPGPSSNDSTGTVTGALPAPNAIVDALEWIDPNGNDMRELTGFSMTWSQMMAGFSNADLNQRYAFAVSLMNGDDTITGGGNSDIIEVGTGGTATISSGAGNDTVYVWQPKNIVYDGGAGEDSVIFDSRFGLTLTPATGAIVNLATGTGTNPFGGSLTLSNVEDVTGTSKSDVLTGNASNNVLDGGLGGDDSIYGGVGDDTIKLAVGLNGAPQTVVADGGPGYDTLNYDITFSATHTNVLDLNNPANNTGAFAHATISNFEAYSFTPPGVSFGSPNVDFRGTSANEYVVGSPGDDILNGGGGNDTLDGGAGKNTLNGGDGDDTLISYQSPGDYLDGGPGIDTAKIDRPGPSGNLKLDISNPSVPQVMSDGTTVVNVERLVFLSGDGNDTITGGALDDYIFGSYGDDLLNGGAGNDTLDGGPGRDTLNGGDGDDTLYFYAGFNGFSGGVKTIDGGPGIDLASLDYRGTTTAATIDFSNPGALHTLADGTTIINVERLAFQGGSGNYTVMGGPFADNLQGGSGNDSLYGGGGNDALAGGAGNDYLDGGPGADRMTGGTGDDTYIVDNASDVVVERPGEGNDTVYASASTYTLADNVENLVGTVTTPQIFNGNGSFNIITLASGDDTVQAGSGGSYIIGNGGNDVLIGGAGGGASGLGNTIYAFGGNDYLQGGAGSPSDVLVATGAGNVGIYGGSGNNYIVGGTGRNIIVGGGGALQSLYGNGSGSDANGDYIVGGYGAGASSVLVENGTGSASLWGGPGNNYEVGGASNDLLVGGDQDDYLFGGNGNDTIYGGGGTDYIYPGAGNDFIWTDNVGQPQSTDYIYEGVGTGVDTVADFTPGDGANHDVLVMTAGSSSIASFADVQSKAYQAGVYTVLPLSNTDQVYLYNVQPFQLTANDFIFT